MDRHKVSAGLLLLRLIGGGFLIGGRSSVWSAMLDTSRTTFSDPFGVGGEFFWALTLFSELVCTVLVMLGVVTRYTAGPPLVAMVVSAASLHGGTPWAEREILLLYALPFLVLRFTGPGDYSVDGRAAAWATNR